MNKFIILYLRMQQKYGKRYSENRKSSVYKLPQIYKPKPSIASSKKKISEPPLFHINENYTSSKISHPPLKLVNRKKITTRNGHPLIMSPHKASAKHLTSDRVKTEHPSSQFKHRSVVEHFTLATDEDERDQTMENFQKYIQKNREHIHQEIKERRKMLQLNPNNVHSKKNPPNSAGHKANHESMIGKQCKKKGNSASLQEESQIFMDIQKIIKEKISSTESNKKIDLNHVQHSVKLAKLIRSIHKMNPQKSIEEIKEGIEIQKSIILPKNSSRESSPFSLKDENNYCQWRRMELQSSKLSNDNYKASTFELQNQRLKDYILKNEVSLSKYMESREELLKLKSNKVKTSIA